MAAQPKHTKEVAEVETTAHAAVNYVTDAGELDGSAAGTSPALQLQAELEARMAPRDYPFSAREVTATVIVFCFATWWALYMLATTFIV